MCPDSKVKPHLLSVAGAMQSSSSTMNNLQYLYLAFQKQEAQETVRMLENSLRQYREKMGPVADVSELITTGKTDLLSMRFAIMKGALVEEQRKNNFLGTQLSLASKRPLQDDLPPVLKKPKLEIVDEENKK